MSSQTKNNQKKLQTGKPWPRKPLLRWCQQYLALQGVYLGPYMNAEIEQQFFLNEETTWINPLDSLFDNVACLFVFICASFDQTASSK